MSDARKAGIEPASRAPAHGGLTAVTASPEGVGAQGLVRVGINPQVEEMTKPKVTGKVATATSGNLKSGSTGRETKTASGGVFSQTNASHGRNLH